MGELDGRLALSLAFLDTVAQLMADESSLSSDVGAHLTAIVFGTTTTTSVLDTADNTVQAMSGGAADEVRGDNSGRRVRRQSRRLGRGWSVGTDGLTWRSRNNRYSFNARPTFSPPGARATFTIRF